MAFSQRKGVDAEMIHDRNLSAHTYNQNVVNRVSDRLPRYLPALRQLLEKLRSLGELRAGRLHSTLRLARRRPHLLGGGSEELIGCLCTG